MNGNSTDPDQTEEAALGGALSTARVPSVQRTQINFGEQL